MPCEPKSLAELERLRCKPFLQVTFDRYFLFWSTLKTFLIQFSTGGSKGVYLFSHNVLRICESGGETMSTGSLRPSIAETSYRVFDRPLHPELFDPVIVGRIRGERYEMSVGICEGGHYLQFTHLGHTIVEVTAPDHQQLSTFGLQQTYFYNQHEEVLFETSVPIQYHFAGEVDVVNFSVFTRVQMELEDESPKVFLAHQFPARNRLLPGPLSLIRVEGNSRMLSIQAFHTFPEDLAILRTQTLIELD